MSPRILSPFSRMLRSFWFGLFCPLAALRIIFRDPKVLFFSAFPITITLALYIYLFQIINNYLYGLLGPILGGIGGNVSYWLFPIVMFLTKIIILLVSGMTFSLCANLIACPFNDFLAEAAEPHTDLVSRLVPSPNWRQRFRLVRIDLFKTITAIVAFVISFLVSWAPVLNIIVPILTSLIIAFQYISYPQTRRGEGILKGIQFLQRNFIASWGFGIAASFLLSIPVVSAFFLPLVIIGGTILYSKDHK